MPHDRALLADVMAWLRKASDDLRAGEFELGAEPPLIEDILFHTQQASEKSLKGFLVWHGQPFRKTHSLEEVGEQCLAIDETLRPLVDLVVPLTEYAWRFRYPGPPQEPSLDEARDALSRAHQMYEAILARLPEEAHPGR
jgi:HEPN domain-containing protein